MPRKSRITNETIIKLIEHFIAGTPARSCASLCHVSRETATKWYYRFRDIITEKLTIHVISMRGEIEVDESYFG